MSAQSRRLRAAKRAGAQLDKRMRRSLAEAHREGRHADDPTGYWRELGCPLCLGEREFRVVDHRTQVTYSVIHDVWTLRRDGDDGVWTAIIYRAYPEKDIVIDPSGHITPRAVEVPAGLWFCLTHEYKEKGL